MAFTTLVLFQLFNVFNARSDTDSAFKLMLRNHRRAKKENKLFRFVGGRSVALGSRKAAKAARKDS